MGGPVYPLTSPTLLGKLANPENTREWNDAWQRLTDLYRRVILWRCRKQGLQDSDAADVVQTVQLKLLELMKTYEFRRRLRAILIATVDDLLRGLGGESSEGLCPVLTRILEEHTSDGELARKIRKDLAADLSPERQALPFPLKVLTSSGEDEDGVNEFLALARHSIERCGDSLGLPDADRDALTGRVLDSLRRVLGDPTQVPLPKFHSWLDMVVRNAARDCLKDVKKIASREGNALLDQFVGTGESDEFVREIELRELRQEAEARVRGVSERDWTIYRLIVHDGWSGKDVAERLGLSEASVYVYCGRVRKKVAEQIRLLESEDGEEASHGGLSERSGTEETP